MGAWTASMFSGMRTVRTHPLTFFSKAEPVSSQLWTNVLIAWLEGTTPNDMIVSPKFLLSNSQTFTLPVKYMHGENTLYIASQLHDNEILVYIRYSNAFPISALSAKLPTHVLWETNSAFFLNLKISISKYFKQTILKLVF